MNTDARPMPVSWRDAAACRSGDAEQFFPRGVAAELAEPAKAVCRRCPVIRECLRYALSVDVDGIWGATTKPERDAIRAAHHIVPEPVVIERRGADYDDDIAALTAKSTPPSVIADRLGIPIWTVYDRLRVIELLEEGRTR